MESESAGTDSRKCYRVRKWDTFFEGAKSKTYNNKSTCSMPTKHGLGFKKLIRNRNGSALFGAWCAMIQVISRHEKPRSGYCTHDGRSPATGGIPLTGDDLELLTDIQAKLFDEMFVLCCSQSVGWLDVVYFKDSTRIQQGTMVSPQYPLNSDSNLNSNPDSYIGGYPPDFCTFWKVYPKKTGKAAAFTSWKKKKAAMPNLESVIAILEEQKKSDQWTRDCGQFIPNPATWINQGRWDDEPVEKLESVEDQF